MVAKEADNSQCSLKSKELCGKVSMRASTVNTSDARVGIKELSENGCKDARVVGSRGVAEKCEL
jgi:hypothetical protein